VSIWAKLLAWVLYRIGIRAGVAQQRAAETEGFNHAAQAIADAEDHAPASRDQLVDRVRRAGL
jgi:hypothetical protein